MTIKKSDPFIVDEIILVCNGCQLERKFVIEPHIYSAQELIDWINTKPTPCNCGAKTCNVKARIKPVS